MRTIRTKQELITGIKNGETHFRCEGEVFKALERKRKITKASKIGGVMASIGGIAVLPFTGGLSGTALLGSGAMMAASSTTISTAALIIILGSGAIALAAVLKGRNVSIQYYLDHCELVIS